MELVVFEWGSALIRWLHVIAGMAWIGASFFFMHLDSGLRPHADIPAGKGGAAWHVHGGGFYEMKKYLVAPARLPAELTWHKWQSYATWLSGFILLGWIYYAQSSLYLIDPAVRAMPAWAAAAIGIGSLMLGWVVYDRLCKSRLSENETLLAVFGFAFVIGMSALYAQLFSGRGALIHTGALMATFMTGNVAMIIIPNQKTVVAALVAGEAPDPKYGKEAKQRSVHNNYLTLPVVLMMVANHYPLMQTSWAIPILVALVTFAGGIVRHFFNHWHADHARAPWWYWGAAALAVLAAIWLSWWAAPGRQALADARVRAASGQVAGITEAAEIVATRCSACHAASPVWEGIGAAPKAVRLEAPDEVAREAHAIIIQAVLTRAMPPNNLTDMTEDERARLALWFAAREK
jgi:uncharacterized membrane protein